MFDNFRKEDTDLEEAIASAYAELKNYEADTDEYKKITNQLKRLYSLKRQRHEWDPNKLAMVAGNIFVALVVIKYEQTGVITTRLHNFLQKI